MADRFAAQGLLQSLRDFSDPAGAASSVQIDSLLNELRPTDAVNSDQKFRLTEDGPEVTLAEMLAAFEVEEREIEALRQALIIWDKPA